MNIVTNQVSEPEVLLIRALEPIEGIELMKKRRNTDKVKLLCNGPGKLSQAMGITKENYGERLKNMYEIAVSYDYDAVWE